MFFKKREKKEEFVDDGRVIADMDTELITGYKSKKHRELERELKETDLTRQERWAIYKGALMQYMPIFGMFIGSLVLVIFLLYFFWMN